MVSEKTIEELKKIREEGGKDGAFADALVRTFEEAENRGIEW